MSLLVVQVGQQSVEKRALVGVQQLTRFLDGDESRLIDLPGGTTRRGVSRGRTGEAVNALAALDVFDGAQGNQRVGDDAGLFAGLASGRSLGLFAAIGEALRNAPR